MTRVFLSFASEDSSVARRLAEFFEELGVVVFRYALRREAELRTPSVRVIKVAEVSRARAGLLGNYQWLDATGQLARPRLSEISGRLPLDGRAVEAAADIRAQAEIPDIRNRHDELTTLRAADQTPGGREAWVVVAPPLMGKSWLLARLEQALTTAEKRWTVRHLDLRRAPLELRSNPPRLVGP